MTNTLIKNFKQISKTDTLIAGGKGASLGEMTQAGIPVPDGFIILSGVFDKFIKETKLNLEINTILNNINLEKVYTVENASKKIQEIILRKEIPKDIKKNILKFYKKLDCKLVAVRSSATSEDSVSATWAGQLDSFLNTSEKTLLENIKKCWTSLFTPRAIFYRFEKKLYKKKISIAVVVQKMIQSEKSGIAFSIHPISKDENQIMIEAGFGLGEAIVSGLVTPDNYIVDKQKLEILNMNVRKQTRALYKKVSGGNKWKEIKEMGIKQVLTKKEIIKLSKLIIKIESHYNFPCDIEWAKEKDKLYIIQSRPVTTSTKNNKKLNLNNPALKKFNPNDWVFQGHWKQNLFSSYFWESRFDKKEAKKINLKISEPGSLILSDGNFFYKKSMIDEIKAQILSHIDNKNELFFINLKNNADKIIKKSIYFAKKHKDSEVNQKNFKKMILWAQKLHFYWYLTAVPFNITLENLLKDSLAKNNISKNNIFDIVPKFETPLLKQKKELIKLKKRINNKSLNDIKNDKILLSALNKHLIDYSWIEVANWIGDKLTLNRLYEQILNSTNEGSINKKHKISSKTRFIAKCFSHIGYTKQISAEMVSKYSLIMRPFLTKVANRFNITYNEMMYLSGDEIINLFSKKKKSSVRAIIKNRKKFNWAIKAANNHKSYLISEKNDIKILKKIMLPEISTNINIIKGETANPGEARGVAKIILNSENFKNFEKGDILVTTMTTPDFVILMQKASAIVTDIGGLLSHAAIISRELNIPCIIGTSIATKIIKNGDLIKVNANNGTINILN